MGARLRKVVRLGLGLALGLVGCHRGSGDAAPAASSDAPRTPWDTAEDACEDAVERADGAAAERACNEAVRLGEAFGPNDERLATSVHMLGIHREHKGDYKGAEALNRRAIAIWEAKDAKGVNAAIGAMSLAAALQLQGRRPEAAAMYERAEATFEREHRDADLAKLLNNLGNLRRDEGDLARAEPLLRRALALKEKVSGADSLDTAISLQNLAVVLDEANRLPEADALYRRALAIKEAKLGKDHPSVALTLTNLGALEVERKDYAAAEPLLRRAVAIRDRGESSPEDTRVTSSNLAKVLRATGRDAEAATLEGRVAKPAP